MDKTQKKKKRIKALRSELADIPFGVCVFLIVVGLAIGSIIVIGTWYLGAPIDRSDAIPVCATFDSYEAYYTGRGALSELEIRFLDHETLFIDGMAATIDIEALLETLSSGERVELLLHPNSGDIWEMTCGDRTILPFDGAKNGIMGENVVSSAVGVLGYGCAAVGLAALVVQSRERKRIKQRVGA